MSDAPAAPIALDAVGGDHAPASTVAGAVEAVQRHGLRVLLVGPRETIRDALPARAVPGIEVVDAPDQVTMDDPPVVVLRRKRRSSLMVCAQLVRDGRAAAMVTAGNTGAAWVAAKSALGMIPGIERPALAAIVPSVEGRTLLLDVGANVDCGPRNLAEFAIMGSLYASEVLGIATPRVGLMSIGEEEGKGGRRIREWHGGLVESGVDYVGNVEGRDLFAGGVDVVVCDGFTGNVVLKTAEGVGEMIMAALRDEARRSPVYGAGLLMAKGAFRNLRRKVDYSEYGGAPLLGVAGACLICHGRSSSKAIRNALRFASSYAASGIIDGIAEAVADGGLNGGRA